MSLRIRFNGQEYPGIEAMPADVRAAFQQDLDALPPSMRAFFEKGIARAKDAPAADVVLSLDQTDTPATPSDRPGRQVPTLVLFMLLGVGLILVFVLFSRGRH